MMGRDRGRCLPPPTSPPPPVPSHHPLASPSPSSPGLTLPIIPSYHPLQVLASSPRVLVLSHCGGEPFAAVAARAREEASQETEDAAEVRKREQLCLRLCEGMALMMLVDGLFPLEAHAPGNLLVQEGAVPVLLDFGLCKRLSSHEATRRSPATPRPQLPVGIPVHRAPLRDRRSLGVAHRCGGASTAPTARRCWRCSARGGRTPR